MFNKKGKSVTNGIDFLMYIKMTFPNEIAINTYKKVQTGPKTQLGGDHVGLMLLEYQFISFVDLIIHYEMLLLNL